MGKPPSIDGASGARGAERLTRSAPTPVAEVPTRYRVWNLARPAEAAAPARDRRAFYSVSSPAEGRGVIARLRAAHRYEDLGEVTEEFGLEALCHAEWCEWHESSAKEGATDAIGDA
jgi:hypothetical protein